MQSLRSAGHREGVTIRRRSHCDTRLTPDTRHLGFDHRAGARVIVTVAFRIGLLSLAFAASAPADDPAEAGNAGRQHVTTDEHGGVHAVRGQGPAAHPREPPPTRDPGVSTARDEPSAPCPWPWQEFGPWPESDPGHDKCRKWRGYPLPPWCFGPSNWPVLKAQPVMAIVTGTRGGGVYPPTRRKHF
jgi:hypothetical protein